MKLKKRKQLISVIAILFLITIAVLLVKWRTNGKSFLHHRRESWLSYIHWDQSDKEYTGKNVKIAVIDTGIDCETPELKAQLKEVNTQIGGDNHLAENDILHGTAVCGIIAACPQNANQVLGVAPDVEISFIDVGADEYGSVSIENLTAGIQLAVDQKVDIINISIGVTNGSPELEAAIERAISNDIIVVASAGNYMENNILYPAKYSNVLCVGYVDRQGTKVSPIGELSKHVIYLPGENIVTCIKANEYAGCEGSSFSTAICTGLVALLLEKNNDKVAVYDYLQKLEINGTADFADILKEFH